MPLLFITLCVASISVQALVAPEWEDEPAAVARAAGITIATFNKTVSANGSTGAGTRVGFQDINVSGVMERLFVEYGGCVMKKSPIECGCALKIRFNPRTGIPAHFPLLWKPAKCGVVRHSRVLMSS